jgi:DNA-binding XRE family transcriptional regulator
MHRPAFDLMIAVRTTLRLSQNELARQVGVSRRTGQRWNSGRGPLAPDLHTMARLVYPVDPALAAEVCEAGRTTLEALGIVPPPAPAPPPPPAPPPAPVAPPDRVVDAVIVCAAAEAIQATPQSVRPAVLAAFACARELGLTVEGVERVLRASVVLTAP